MEPAWHSWFSLNLQSVTVHAPTTEACGIAFSMGFCIGPSSGSGSPSRIPFSKVRATHPITQVADSQQLANDSHPLRSACGGADESTFYVQRAEAEREDAENR